MPDVMAERRAAPRYALIVVAEVTELSSGARLTARTSDVSRTGCYVDTLNPIPSGTPVRIVLAKGGENFEVSAKIVYVSPGLGMGVHFDSPVPPTQLAILDRWLQFAARTTL
ncbi:MAG TPA: PilZ domain-containing protein [Candidatus Acidoferrum sp.]|nr:PilZ domain-containing protein [Candidatus Acidoferrum sp.]